MEQRPQETLQERLERLSTMMEQAKKCGIRGEQMAQRAEHDLLRIMNSAWLNMYELVDDYQQQLNPTKSEPVTDESSKPMSGLKSDKYLDVHVCT